MIFASYISKYRTTLQRESAQYFAPGQKNVIKPRVRAVFRAGVPDFVVDAVRAKWPKSPVHYPLIGGPSGEVNWHSVVSVWDSKEAQREHQWSDEERVEFENKMLNHPKYGIRFIAITPTKIAAPWPAYDNLKAQGKRTIEMVAEKIAEKVREDGYLPANVIAYEKQNLNRPLVIKALEALTEEETVLEVTV